VREAGLGYMLLLPAFLIFSVFVFYPFLAQTSYLGFFSTPPFPGQPKNYVGLDQYKDVLSSSDFLDSLKTTITFAINHGASEIALRILLAVLAHQKLKGIGLYRTFFSSTVATSIAVAAVIFGTLLSPQVGLLQGIQTEPSILQNPFAPHRHQPAGDPELHPVRLVDCSRGHDDLAEPRLELHPDVGGPASTRPRAAEVDASKGEIEPGRRRECTSLLARRRSLDLRRRVDLRLSGVRQIDLLTAAAGPLKTTNVPRLTHQDEAQAEVLQIVVTATAVNETDGMKLRITGRLMSMRGRRILEDGRLGLDALQQPDLWAEQRPKITAATRDRRGDGRGEERPVSPMPLSFWCARTASRMPERDPTGT